MTTTGPDYYEKQSAQDSRMSVLETKVQDLEEQLERFKAVSYTHLTLPTIYSV